jgi:hypothetical protein
MSAHIARGDLSMGKEERHVAGEQNQSAIQTPRLASVITIVHQMINCSGIFDVQRVSVI